jgi:GT2 family glycosyltransferase/glycosyltransferase involved in cell wall biosynthesis
MGSRSPSDRLRILVVHSELPLHDRHSGSLRLFRLLELLAAEGHAITFLARCGIGQERYTAQLTALGIDVLPLDRARLRERGMRVAGPDLDFAELCARGRFDVALLSFYELAEQYLPLLRRCSPLTRVVVDTVDVHWVRERRGAELSGDRRALAAAERTRERERAVYSAADALVAVSEEDAGVLRELAPGVPVAVVSNVHAEVPGGDVGRPGFSARDGLVFVANFAHAPNVDAILDFHARIWPLVRAGLPDVALSLVGTDPPEAVRALASDPAIEVTGWVESTEPYLDRARVSIAPLRYGAGVKGKIGEALSHGLPVVTTTIGAEGMGLVDGSHALVADSAEGFAEAVVSLHSDGALWERVAEAGREHVRATLSPRAALDALRGLLSDVARTAFVLSVDPRRDAAAALTPALERYVSAFAVEDPVSLVLAVPDDAGPDALEAVLAAAGGELERLGRDPEAVPDIAVTPFAGELPLPGGAVRVKWTHDAEPAAKNAANPSDNAAAVSDSDPSPSAATVARETSVAGAHAGGVERAIPADTEAARWRELALGVPTPARRRPTPRAALLLHAIDDPAAFTAQLDAVARAGVPDDVELVIAAGDPEAQLEAALQRASGARIVRTAGRLGRAAAWQLGALATRADVTVALAPLAMPEAGFLDPLIDAVRRPGGPALVAPIVAGAHGLHVAADGSLWPRAGGADPATGPSPAGARSPARTPLVPGETAALADAPLTALPLDCLAMSRELLATGLPELPAGEGHRETQLAAWAAEHGGSGGIALAPEAHVSRLPAPPASILICTRNRADELPDGVALLVAAGALDVVIVDNGSTDATPEVAAELAQCFPGVVRVVEEPEAGLCHARNAGAAAAKHELLVYVDDDARVAPGWLEHIAHALARPGVVNAGGPICALWPGEREPGWPGRDLECLLSILDLGDAKQSLVPPDVVYGANWAVRRSALLEIGGFDPAFGPAPGRSMNGDEVNVAWRLHRAGLGATLYAPGAAVGHRISPERVGDRFLIERAYNAGLERPRHKAALGDVPREELRADAERAAQRLQSRVPLSGDLTTEAALDAISADPQLPGHAHAADALGELAAWTQILDEDHVAETPGLQRRAAPVPAR